MKFALSLLASLFMSSALAAPTADAAPTCTNAFKLVISKGQTGNVGKYATAQLEENRPVKFLSTDVSNGTVFHLNPKNYLATPQGFLVDINNDYSEYSVFLSKQKPPQNDGYFPLTCSFGSAGALKCTAGVLNSFFECNDNLCLQDKANPIASPITLKVVCV